MEGIRQWVWLLCLASLLTAALRGLLPAKELSGVIKLVLRLYILLLLFSPAAGRSDLPAFAAQVQPPAAQIDLSQTLLQEAQLRLQVLLEQALTAAKIPFDAVQIRCGMNGEEVVIEDIAVWAAGAEREDIATVIRQTLGITPPCSIIESETDGSG